MGRRKGRLALYEFGPGDPLAQLPQTLQVQYLRFYLADLNAVSVLEEPEYFDRDYLAEHSAFYCTSARGYPNLCRRLHFFKDRKITRRKLTRALGGNSRVRKNLESDYLGFVVIRPIDGSPLGRTVLCWYDDQSPATPRVTSPAREYVCHVAGMPLQVTGLAWQQQDQAVSACATIALWTMLHSSGFDDHHAIPTTATITRRAHNNGALTLDRMFPSSGLNPFQVCQAIRASHLEPIASTGDVDLGSGQVGFSRARFAGVLASLIRSGYPVLIGGELKGLGPHAVCAVGFREASATPPSANSVQLQDEGVTLVYLHDDNLGPNVRFKVTTGSKGEVRLVPDPPTPRHSLNLPSPTAKYPEIVPSSLVAAVHEDLRTSADAIHEAALRAARNIVALFKLSGRQVGLTVSTRFARLPVYLNRDLPAAAASAAASATARLALAEEAGPMSLHLGVARIGWGGVPTIDMLFDTTDSNVNLRVFASVVYRPVMAHVLNALQTMNLGKFGTVVAAY